MKCLKLCIRKRSKENNQGVFMVIEYSCPRCKKQIVVVSLYHGSYKYKVICGACSYQNYIDDLNLLKGIDKCEDREKLQ